MTSGVEFFPQTLPAQTIAGNPRSQPGPVAALPYSVLAGVFAEASGVVSVATYGAVGDGVTDDAGAFKAAMAASQYVVIPFSAAGYAIGSTLGTEWANKSGCWLVSLCGSGPPTATLGSVLKWIGGASGTFLKLTGVRDSIFENLAFTCGSAPNTLSTVIDCNPTGETQIMSNNTFTNISITARGGASAPDGSIQYGFRISRSTSPGNVSEFTYINTFIAGVSVAGVSLEHSQARNHRFYHANFIFMPIGITNGLNSSTGGSWSCYEPNMGEITDTCFRPNVADDTCNIFGGHFETVNRIYDATGSTFGAAILHGFSCAGSDGLAADGQIIRIGTSSSNGPYGPINISGCDFFSTESGGSFKAAKIGYTQPAQGSIVISGCAFNNTTPFVYNTGGGGDTNFVSIGNIGWNGSAYVLFPSSGINSVAKSASPVSCPADTTEDTLATITVKGNTLGKNGYLRIWTTWTNTNSGNNKTFRVRFSGASGTKYLEVVTTATDVARFCVEIMNRGATNSQMGSMTVAGSGFAAVAGTFITSAVDTTADTTIVITGQKATSGETLTLERYLVEVIPGY